MMKYFKFLMIHFKVNLVYRHCFTKKFVYKIL